MRKYAALILFVYGFIFGSEYLVHNLTGFILVLDYPNHYFNIAFHFLIYIGLMVSAYLVIKNNPNAKYIALFSLLAWLFYEFEPITWPVNSPLFYERMGIKGWEAWKRTIDIASIGIIHSSLLILATSSLFIKRFNK
ncbi:MAG: hypothetical protein OQK75_11205 [Gammaproteobacteria bacterium]|nr:hypothetical protein [Gammaproteobacteria bacterium]MCW8988220.1 hypothetical protein [Gammaproteobacteria bacterium]MCW9030785.1 hypothetical protein [Gammaproteobacteria bacterium]